ncbi:NAD(P)-dependent oxidoreductase [Amycolatopsis sp. NPDC059021]|uniref:NAD(P)-dependent oxidoreductase n=1 Tax=Amycolatopsis sp. NPDC059021 TaxID=3346704 RepID=UPI003671FB5C
MTSTARLLVSDEPDDKIGQEILGKLDHVSIVTYDPNQSALSITQQSAAIFLPPYRGSHRPIPLVRQISNLKMVQLLSAGTDEYASHVPSHVVLASARGAHAGPVSEWVLSAILAQFRQWPTLVRYQDQNTWAHRKFHADTLAGKRALIVGAGAIGTAVAGLLNAFGAQSTLVASKARNGVSAASDLPTLIRGHQVVVITAPLTDETRGLVGPDFLAAMDDGALLVNAGRGAIVDTNALVAELRKERLRAALDVTDPEPLPPDHPLWNVPGVIISPHSARTVPGTNALCYSVAAEQITAFLAGERPSNAAR